MTDRGFTTIKRFTTQLAAIQGGMGEANKHGAQPEVAENTGSHAMAKNQLSRQEQAVARDVEGVAAPCEASPGNDIFAWATFDGEGSYDLRLFDGNESYRDDFRRNNPKHHPDWVFPLYRNSITAAMAAEVERLRAELAEVKGREAVGEVQLRTGGGISLLHVDLTQPLPPGTKLYASPPASPDVDGLVKALTKTVASLDQLLPYLGKIPADVGLLNDALVAARPLLEQNTNKEVTPDGK